jgi:hypothetical protein
MRSYFPVVLSLRILPSVRHIAIYQIKHTTRSMTCRHLSRPDQNFDVTYTASLYSSDLSPGARPTVRRTGTNEGWSSRCPRSTPGIQDGASAARRAPFPWSCDPQPVASLKYPEHNCVSMPSTKMDVNSILPLFGLRPDQCFASLLSTNQFLYVVHHPRSPSPLVGHGFFAQELRPSLSDDAVVEEAIKRAGLARRSPTDFENSSVKQVVRSYCVSCSFSLPWAVIRADYADAPPDQVRISVVRAASVGMAVLGTEVTNFVDCQWDGSSGTQEVLVVGHIPPSAILADIPWPELLQSLPSWMTNSSSGGLHQPPRVQSPNDIPPFSHFARDWAHRAQFVRPADAVGMSIRCAKRILNSARGPGPSYHSFTEHQLQYDLVNLAVDLLIWPERPMADRPLDGVQARLWYKKRMEAEASIIAAIMR